MGPGVETSLSFTSPVPSALERRSLRAKLFSAKLLMWLLVMKLAQKLESYYNVLLPLKNDSHPPHPFLYSDVIVNSRQPSSRKRGLLVLVLTFVVYY